MSQVEPFRRYPHQQPDLCEMGTMPALQPGNYSLRDRSNGQKTVFSTSTPPNRSGPTAVKSVEHQSPQHEALHSVAQDAFVYDSRYVDVSMIPGIHADKYVQYDDGFAGCISSIARPAALVGGSLLDRPGAVPCNLTARPAIRSNGAPLATIVEQCSRSTLNSRVSLLSMGRSPHPTSPANALSDRMSQKASCDRKETLIQRIQEDRQSAQLHTDTPGDRLPDDDCKRVSASEEPFSLQVNAISPTNFPKSQTGNAEHNRSGKRLSGFYRDVLHTAQATSGIKSWSLSSPPTIAAETKHIQVAPAHGGPRSQREIDTTHTIRSQVRTLHSASSSTLVPTSVPLGDHQTGSRQTPSIADIGISAQADPFLLVHSPPESGSTTDASGVSHLTPLSIVTRPREQSAPVNFVPPEPRDGAHNGGTIGGTRHPSENGSVSSAQYTFDSASACPRNIPSFTEHDLRRDSTRNASLCSTVSTSYSGTVLGVDLDLDRHFMDSHTLLRSRSPTPVALPVWFTPQIAELERQASVSESPEPELRTVLPPTSHSMRSFALPSLLPIAAASGIVTPNYNTPKISFYSPSGNLIQSESSSSPQTSPSDLSSSPSISTSYYNQRRQSIHNSSPPEIFLPPVRPALLPMVTPPVFSAPLPAHLKYHRNYQRRENSKIESIESFVMPTTATVEGCGGIVKSPSFTPRSGTQLKHKHSKSGSCRKRHRSARSLIEDMKFEAKFIKASLITAASTSCNPSRKGRTLRKRDIANRKTAGGASLLKKGHVSSSTLNSPAVEEKGRIPLLLHEHEHCALGLLAGQALRICFCQPYDVSGEPLHVVKSDRFCISGSKTASRESDQTKQAQKTRKEVDGELPNARIIRRSTDLEGLSQRRRRVNGLVRTTSNNIIRVGAGLRVATVDA